MSLQWSPFSCLPQAKLTASGLLELDSRDHEVVLIRRSNVELRYENDNEDGPMSPCPRTASGPWQSRASDLSVTITTHRLVLFAEDGNSKRRMARFLHLSNLHQVYSSGGPSMRSWNASHKLNLNTYTYTGELILSFPSTTKNDRDACQQQLEKALERRAWEMATRLQAKQTTQDQMTRRKVGVDHILTKNKLRHRQAARLADQALSGDAEQLLQEAAALLQVIQKYVKLLQKEEQKDNTKDDPDAQQLSTLLQEMGMTSALSKENAAAQRDEYYEILARQVADFFLPKLAKMGGILTLTDVFCLFNRARGTNLISPEDLAQACQLLEDLNLGISKRTFPSGIVVLQLDQQIMMDYDNLVRLCPTTALEASHVLKVSPLLALEQLEEAERMGMVCRDVTLETTRFFPNRFSEWSGQAA